MSNVDDLPVQLDLAPDSKNLYLFFGGIASNLGMPPFEFFNASKVVDDSRMFIRDFGQVWYHAGLPGFSDDIPSTVEYFRGELERIAPENIVIVGNSMGGFAAILFATLLGRGRVIAFAPQTYIGPISGAAADSPAGIAAGAARFRTPTEKQHPSRDTLI